MSVPVVLGGLPDDYMRLAPPNSFINVDDFSGPEELAKHLVFLNQHPAEYNKYHEWRNNFQVVNEHGYFGAPIRHYCRLCEALNYNDKGEKIYDNLEMFWSKKVDCR